ncbi:PD-(D/E)XK nuclease family protein, partial [Porphyromonas sp.]
AFCWDAAVEVVHDVTHPASKYFQKLIKDFGQVEGPWKEGAKGQHLPQAIQVIECSSLLAQVKGLPSLLQEMNLSSETECLEAAIILPDEGLLLPTASSIPEDIGSINITLGYPLDRTSIALMLKRWIALITLNLKRRESSVRYPADQLLSLLGQELITAHSPEAKQLMERIRRSKRFFIPVQELWSKGKEKEAVAESDLLHLLLDPLTEKCDPLQRIEAVLRHLVERAQERARSVAAPLTSDATPEEDEENFCEGLSPFDLEFIHHYLRLINRLQGLIQQHQMQLGHEAMIHLLEGLVGTVTIPFEGNPLQGLQVMGLLETRLLHFPTMVYLSAQEGALPPKQYSDTLIPYTLRQGFGLPTGRADEDPGQDYTFFQSIARAEQLTFVVAPSSDGYNLGEESRYISLLQYIYGCPIKRRPLHLEAQAEETKPVIKQKEGALWNAFVKSTTTAPCKGNDQKDVRPLSPSKLSTYISCPLRFYYEAICHYREQDSPSLLLASNEFGTVLHRVMEEFYQDLTQSTKGKEEKRLTFTTITKEMIDTILKSEGELSRRVKYAYCAELKLDPNRPLSSLSNIYCQTIERYARELLTWDSAHTDFGYAASERKVYAAFKLSETKTVYLGGIIDRIDEVDGQYRVVDYKTGSAKISISVPQGADSSFRWVELLAIPDNKAILQTLIYCAGLAQTDGLDESKIHPAIFRFKGSDGLMKMKTSYKPLITIPKEGEKRTKIEASYHEMKESFEPFLIEEILTGLYDTEVPFTQTENLKQCLHCPFALSCGR